MLNLYEIDKKGTRKMSLAILGDPLLFQIKYKFSSSEQVRKEDQLMSTYQHIFNHLTIVNHIELAKIKQRSVKLKLLLDALIFQISVTFCFHFNFVAVVNMNGIYFYEVLLPPLTLSKGLNPIHTISSKYFPCTLNCISNTKIFPTSKPFKLETIILQLML